MNGKTVVFWQTRPFECLEWMRTMRESQRLRGLFSMFGRLPLSFTPYQSMGWGARRHFISAHSTSHNHDVFIDGGRGSVNRYDFQPHGSQQLSLLRARALSRGESRYHCQVDLVDCHCTFVSGRTISSSRMTDSGPLACMMLSRISRHL